MSIPDETNSVNDTKQAPRNESDLTDSVKDEKSMQEEEIILDLPDVSDIPGQENIIPPKMNMFADTTIASDGEEGTAVFGDDEENDDDERP